MIFKKITASWQYNFQLRNGSYLPYNQETSSYETAKSYEPLHLLDLKITYQRKAFEIWVQAKNILDKDQQNIENVKLPGRWISGGIVMNVNFNRQKSEIEK